VCNVVGELNCGIKLSRERGLLGLKYCNKVCLSLNKANASRRPHIHSNEMPHADLMTVDHPLFI